MEEDLGRDEMVDVLDRLRRVESLFESAS